MAISRAAAQTKRNAAVRAQHAAKTTHGAGSPEHLAAMDVTRGHGDDMRAAVARGDHSHSTEGAVHTADLESGGGGGGSGGGATGGGGGGTPAGTLPGPGAPSSFVRTRGGYDPDTSIDYTNTNPGYWSSVKSYFENHSNNTMGETGIWIPNLEKEGAGAVGLAAQAGGVRAIKGSNYARALPGEVPGGERSMTLESIFRGGEDKTTGYGGEKLGRLGKISPKYHGVSMLGGEVTKVPGSEYVRRGGDFGGLLGMGAEIDVGLMDRLLGGRDGDGMRLRGTMPSPIGAAATDAAAAGMLGGGMAGGMGGGMAGGMGGGMGGYPVMSLGTHTGYDSPAAASAFKGYGDSIGFNVGPKGGLVYRPWTMDYWKEAGIDPALWGGGGMGGGMSPTMRPLPLHEYTTPRYAVPGGSSPGLASALVSGGATPGGAMGAVGSPGTRMGMTPGLHSSHLGAYETSPGVWVWGPEPGMEGGPVGEGVGTEGYGIAGHPGSLGGMLGLPADFGSKGFGAMGVVGGILGMGGPASEISSGEDAGDAYSGGDAGDHFGGSGYD